MENLRFYFSDNGTDTRTDYSPDGWSEEMISYQRSQVYKGVFKSYSIPLQFVKSDATYLRNIFYSNGYGYELGFKIYRRNVYTNQFELKYNGRLNFGSYKDTKDFVELTLTNGDLSTDLVNKENTLFTIDMPTDTVLNFNGGVYNFETVTSWTSFNVNNSVHYTSNPNKLLGIPIPLNCNQFKDINDGYLQYNTLISDTYNLTVLKDCWLRLNIEIVNANFVIQGITNNGFTCNVKWILNMYRNRGGDVEILDVWNSGFYNINVTNYPDINCSIPYVNNNVSIFGDEPFEALTGDEFGLFFSCEIISTGAIDLTWGILSTTWDFDNPIWLTTKIYAPLPELPVNCITGKELFTQLGVKLGNYPVKSDFLDSCKLLLTPGKSFLYTPTEIKTSISDFFKALNSVYSIRLGVEIINGVETLVLEDSNSLVGVNEIVSYADINGFELKIAENIIPNNINVGYELRTYGDEFGMQEYNTKQIWKAPQNLIKTDFDWISPYRADITGPDYIRKQGIEFLKNEVGGTFALNTFDSGSNDDVFMFDCIPDPDAPEGAITYYILDRVSKVITSGVPFPEFAFNTMLTPYEMLKNHGTELRDGLPFMESLQITDEANFKNIGFYSQKPEEGIVHENQPIYIVNLDRPKLYPFIVNFTAPIRWAVADDIEANMYGKIVFTYLGNEFEGIINKIDIRFAGDQSNSVEVLLLSSNNLSKFVK